MFAGTSSQFLPLLVTGAPSLVEPLVEPVVCFLHVNSRVRTHTHTRTGAFTNEGKSLGHGRVDQVDQADHVDHVDHVDQVNQVDQGDQGDQVDQVCQDSKAMFGVWVVNFVENRTATVFSHAVSSKGRGPHPTVSHACIAEASCAVLVCT